LKKLIVVGAVLGCVVTAYAVTRQSLVPATDTAAVTEAPADSRNGSHLSQVPAPQLSADTTNPLKDYALLGTVAGDDPSLTRALISQKGVAGSGVYYGVGDELLPGGTIAAVRSRAVDVRLDSGLYTLTLTTQSSAVEPDKEQPAGDPVANEMSALGAYDGESEYSGTLVQPAEVPAEKRSRTGLVLPAEQREAMRELAEGD